MFDTTVGDYSSAKTGLKRDYVAAFVEAARKSGMLAGLYYSPLDWRYPGFFFPDMYRKSAEAMRAQFHTQMEELMSNYGRIDVVWFDGGETDWLNFGGDWVKPAGWRKRAKGEHYRGSFDWQPQAVFTMMCERQPHVIINDRANMPEDFKSREGERNLGEFDANEPWELCTTLAGAWGWQPNREVKPVAHWIRLLVNVAGRDGNLLLNVGPRPDGQIDPPQVERLREIGRWLAEHGESIYATRGGPFLPGDYGVSTRRDHYIYVHVLKWAGDKLRLPAIPAKIIRASILPEGKASFTQTEQNIELEVSQALRNTTDTVIKLELDRPLAGVKPLPVPPSQE